MMLDIAIGGEFTFDGRKYRIVEDDGCGCEKCAFANGNISPLQDVDRICARIACCKEERGDGKSAHPEFIINYNSLLVKMQKGSIKRKVTMFTKYIN